MAVDLVTTHSDWVFEYGNWGTPGVRHIIDKCRGVGARRVYWRTHGGARAHYRSRLDTVWDGSKSAELYDLSQPGLRNHLARLRHFSYRDWDPYRAAAEYSREVGQSLFAWYTLFEESHRHRGVSRFATAHPEFCIRDREGVARRSKLSFAFPEVVEHKLAVLDEILGYNPDGILLDFVRQNPITPDEHGVSFEDQDNVYRYGYEAPLLERFRKATGRDPMTIPNGDPEWIAHRCQPVTDFLGRARARFPGVPVVAMIGDPTDYRERFGLDWQAWVRDGRIDELMLMIGPWDLGDLEVEPLRDRTTHARAVTPSSVDLTVGVYVYNIKGRTQDVGATNLEKAWHTAREAGADGLVVWETTPMERWSGPVQADGLNGLWPVVRRLGEG